MIKTTLINCFGKDKEIKSEKDLLADLAYKENEGQVVVLLSTVNLGVLTIGIGKELGFVQHSDEKRPSPYLVATESHNTYIDRSCNEEFSQGGTLTPIPKSLCLPMPVVRKICIQFLETGTLPDFVEWTPI